MTAADVGNVARTAPEERALSVDRTFDLLANERRRALAAYLLDASHEVHVDELVDALAGAHSDERQVATRLHHAHLPKLAAAGMIEWDGDRSYVEPTPRLAEFEPFLLAASAFDEQSG